MRLIPLKPCLWVFLITHLVACSTGPVNAPRTNEPETGISCTEAGANYKPRVFVIQYRNLPTSEWAAKLNNSVNALNAVTADDKFRAACATKRMRGRLNGESSKDACLKLTCSDDSETSTPLIIDFFENPGTRAIASHGNGYTKLNSAKIKSGAGDPGNLMHEYSHSVGYRHWTNLRFFAKGYVPYVIGDAVEGWAR